MSKLSKSLSTLARQAGGSFKTVADRMKIDRMHGGENAESEYSDPGRQAY